PLLGDAVDVGSAIAHHAAVVGADVPVTDVVAPDHEDVRSLARRSGLRLDGAVVRHTYGAGPCEPIGAARASLLAGRPIEGPRLLRRAGVRLLERLDLPRRRRVAGEQADHEDQHYLSLRVLQHDASLLWVNSTREPRAANVASPRHLPLQSAG